MRLLGGQLDFQGLMILTGIAAFAETFGRARKRRKGTPSSIAAMVPAEFLLTA